MVEQRQSPRRIFKTRALLAMEGEGPVAGRTADLGAHGVSVNLPAPLKPGQSGQVAFDLMVDGKGVKVSARSTVQYCILSNGEFKVGLQFVNLELAAMTALARFLRQGSPG